MTLVKVGSFLYGIGLVLEFFIAFFSFHFSLFLLDSPINLEDYFTGDRVKL